MSQLSRGWSRRIASRFSGREDLRKNDAIERFWPHLDRQSVIALFDMIELEFGISAGLLRPGDSLEKLCRPVETLNPLKWLVFQMKANDKKTELNRELGRRLNRYGTRDKWNSIATVDDLVRAWSGDIPSPMDR